MGVGNDFCKPANTVCHMHAQMLMGKIWQNGTKSKAKNINACSEILERGKLAIESLNFFLEAENGITHFKSLG